MSASSMFSRYRINNTNLNNRLVVATMTRVTASEDGIASDRMLSYYEDFSRGGFGIVITEENAHAKRVERVER